jgi:glycerate kinase
MKFVIAPDSFKESMTAKEACQAIQRGLRKALPEAVCIQVPLADGGEGTMQALVDAIGGRIYNKQVTGSQWATRYGLLCDFERSGNRRG